jgi:hypothetical protein
MGMGMRCLISSIFLTPNLIKYFRFLFNLLNN